MQKRQQDIVREAVSLFQQLRNRRSELQNELNQIDRALNEIRGDASAANVSFGSIRPAGRRGRGLNVMSLREAVTAIVARRALTRREILQGVQDFGYKFSSKNPGKSLDVFLYGTGKHLFKRVDGKFELVKGASSNSSAGAAKPAKARRKMSAAARAKIAAAAKARWARVKAGK